MQENTQSNLVVALHRSYGWKPPIQQTKNGQFSLALYLVALAFFLFRFLWPLQAAKALLRWIEGPEHDVPPWLGESYVFGSLALEGIVCVTLLVRPSLRWTAPWLAVLLVWKASETLTSNLYYLLLRPVLELRNPHNSYRSFILAAAGSVELWLLFSFAWLFAGVIVAPDLHRSLPATLAFTCSFFGIGTPFVPVGYRSYQLWILSSVFLKAMAFLLLVGAIQLVRPSEQSSNR